MHFDNDPQELAFRRATTAVAQAAHNGAGDQIKAAQQQLSAAISAFPENRHEALNVVAKRQIRSHINTLNREREKNVATHEATELQAALEKWEQEQTRRRW